MQLSNRVLGHISSQIFEGKPLWGLLMANEYLDSNSALIRALRLKAKMELEANGIRSDTSGAIKIILGGAKLSALSLEQRNQVTAIEKKLAPKYPQNKRRYALVSNAQEDAPHAKRWLNRHISLRQDLMQQHEQTRDVKRFYSSGRERRRLSSSTR